MLNYNIMTSQQVMWHAGSLEPRLLNIQHIRHMTQLAWNRMLKGSNVLGRSSADSGRHADSSLFGSTLSDQEPYAIHDKVSVPTKRAGQSRQDGDSALVNASCKAC